jgi:outer membrane protein OmpA-like peptidoglycan-associated protein
MLLLFGGANIVFAQTKSVYKVDVTNVTTKVKTTLYVLARSPEEAAQEVSLNGWQVEKVEPFGRYRAAFKGNVNEDTTQLTYILTIYFEPCKYSVLIDNETVSKIKELDPVKHYIIYGHADSSPVKKVEEFKNNYELSIKRAEFVKNFIISITDIPSDNIHVVGLGEFYPKIDNTINGALENRRVEVYERY